MCSDLSLHLHDHDTPDRDAPSAPGHRHARNRRRLLVVAVAMGAVAAVEVAAGLLANSLALLSDAAHAGSDAVAMALALGAVHVALTRPADKERTFGYHRSEVLAALANGALLWVVAAFIVVEAVQRAQAPAAVRGDIVTVAAVAILGVEATAGLYLHRGGASRNLNVRGAMVHLLGDAAATVGVLVSGLVIAFTGWTLVDPLVASGLAVVLAVTGTRLVRSAGHILLQGAPDDVPTGAVRDAMLAVDGVADVHDLHVWSITQGVPTVSAHVVCTEDAPRDLHRRLRQALKERFGVDHVTLQVEPPDCFCDEPHHP